MSELGKKLEAYGCVSFDTTMERFLNDDEFYLEILEAMLTDPGFEQLGEEIKTNDTKRIFEVAHMLKGVIANCGITPMFDSIEKIVDSIKKNQVIDFQAVYEVLMKQRDEVLKIVKE